eukprot:TRINITY_DN132_c0_g1_i1.p1 TRINITY_DN132_c0_g1~~TRINITY_DN132_c0_g1_i1.p1  ORF type:complete len:149 (-),score=36.37 TRINITY_DN132_c0_g1_i1:102-548(-)
MGILIYYFLLILFLMFVLSVLVELIKKIQNSLFRKAVTPAPVIDEDELDQKRFAKVEKIQDSYSEKSKAIQDKKIEKEKEKILRDKEIFIQKWSTNSGGYRLGNGDDESGLGSQDNKKSSKPTSERSRLIHEQDEAYKKSLEIDTAKV